MKPRLSVLDCAPMVEVYPIHYDDVYFAEVAAAVLELVAECDEETAALVITCLAYNAECNLSRN